MDGIRWSASPFADPRRAILKLKLGHGTGAGKTKKIPSTYLFQASGEDCELECILIGTGGMMPMSYRMLTSLAVRLNGQLYLFDAGEGTQINWKRARLGMRGLKLIAVTHLHADHCLGIPGMIMLRAQMENPDPLTILGPPGTREFISQSQRTLEYHVNFPIHIIEWASDNSGLAYQDGQARIVWQPVKHTRFCLGYRFEELDRPGKFDSARAQALGVPMGPLWGKLQKGESVNTLQKDCATFGSAGACQTRPAYCLRSGHQTCPRRLFPVRES